MAGILEDNARVWKIVRKMNRSREVWGQYFSQGHYRPIYERLFIYVLTYLFIYLVMHLFFFFVAVPGKFPGSSFSPVFEFMTTEIVNSWKHNFKLLVDILSHIQHKNTALGLFDFRTVYKTSGKWRQVQKKVNITVLCQCPFDHPLPYCSIPSPDNRTRKQLMIIGCLENKDP